MLYSKFPPTKQLQPFVHCYYVWESSSSLTAPLTIESPPSGFPSIVFNYGDRYTVSTESKKDLPTTNCFFAGQSIKRYQLHLLGKIGMLGIVFQPAGLSALFKIPMHEFVEERVALSMLFGKETPLLLEQIFETKDFAQKVTIVENQLLKHLLDLSYTASALDFATNYIVAQNGNFKMDDLLAQVFMSRRQFERRFLKRVGLSPKYYGRVRRISNLCRIAVSKKEINWQILFGNAGYYDQAHFIKDFKEFMGAPPTEYYAGHAELVKYLGNS